MNQCRTSIAEEPMDSVTIEEGKTSSSSGITRGLLHPGGSIFHKGAHTRGKSQLLNTVNENFTAANFTALSPSTFK